MNVSAAVLGSADAPTSTSPSRISTTPWPGLSGARPAELQPQADVRVMLDPAGHPFCLFRPE